jgi:hypothetical protein
MAHRNSKSQKVALITGMSGQNGSCLCCPQVAPTAREYELLLNTFASRIKPLSAAIQAATQLSLCCKKARFKPLYSAGKVLYRKLGGLGSS